MSSDHDEPWSAEAHDYRIIKERVKVALTLEGEPELEGELFLLPYSGVHEGRERVLDLLLGAEAFLPLRTAGVVQFINKRRVVMVRVAERIDIGLGESEPLAREMEISLEIAGGDAPVRGKVRLTSPNLHPRLMDLLNEPAPLLPLLREGDALLVAKHYVLRASECQG